MILVDTSVWIDHNRIQDATLFRMLEEGSVLAHPLVMGELAMGTLKQRDLVLASLHELPQAIIAYEDEVLRFVSRHSLFGTGIGYIDAHLLLSVKLTGGAVLWTRDKKLSAAAEQLKLAWPEPRPS